METKEEKSNRLKDSLKCTQEDLNRVSETTAIYSQNYGLIIADNIL